MRERITTLLVAAATIGACAVFATTLVHASFYYQNQEEISPPEPVAAPTSVAPKSTRETPSRLIIPGIGVDAHIQSVGIARSGNMAVPSNFTDVGWLRSGTFPGKIGSAVIDGHVDNGFSMDAVFKHVGDLRPGDDIYVETTKGRTVHFIVSNVETYNAAEVPSELVFDRQDQARLNLITCAGTWSQENRAYDERIVVYSVLAQ